MRIFVYSANLSTTWPVSLPDNYVSRRGLAFILGAVVLSLMWVIFILRILLGI